MKFFSTIVLDAFVIELERLGDARGFFARTWCQQEAAVHGLHPTWMQCSISFGWLSARSSTAVHYQAAAGRGGESNAGALHLH